jgi:hypothetical protein
MLRALAPVAEQIDVPRQVVKEHVIEPVVPDISIPGKIPDPRKVSFGPGGWGPDLMRAARAGKPALGALLKNPQARSFLDDAMRAGGKAPIEDIRPRPQEAVAPRVPEAAPTRVTPPIADEFDTTVRSAIEQMRENRLATKPKVSAERGARLAASEEAYQAALRAGKTRDEALRIKRGTQAGEYAKPKGAVLELAPEQQEIIGRRVDSFDFGRGAGPDWERDRVRGALVRLGTGEPVPENELLSLEKVLGKEFADELKASGRQLPDGLWEWSYELALVPKAILSSFDQSAVLRQNIMAVSAHPIEAKESLMPAMKALLREDWAQAANRTILENSDVIRLADGDTITFAEAYDKFHTMRALGGGLAESEERWRGQLAERIPWLGRIIRRSNAGFATYGNQMRDRIFQTVVRNWTEGGALTRKLGLGSGRPPTLQELEALSDSLNRFTGRGTFKGAGGMAKGITDTLQAFQWSPLSRVAPLEAAAQMFNFRNPRVAMQATRDVLAFVGTGTTILGLAHLAGARVTLDPNDTDFGKIVAGKLHINLWGTAQPLARTISRVLTGTRIDPALGPVPVDKLGELQNYLVSGLAPEWSAIWDIAHGTEFPGQPLVRGTPTEMTKRQLLNRGAPLVIQEILEVGNEEGLLVGAATAPLSFFGASVSAYGPSEKQQLRQIPEFSGGLSLADVSDINSWLTAVDEQRDEWRLEDGRDVSRQEAIPYIAEAEGKEEHWADWALMLASGKWREENRNPEWLQFVVENYDALLEQWPGKMKADYIQDAVREYRGEAAVR